jgi:hypothetical protein
LVLPQFINPSINPHHQRSTIIFQEEIDEKNQDDDHDRQLVCSLPD